MEKRNKFAKILEDKEFVESIFKMETPEEVQKAFADKGIEISKEEVQGLGTIINIMCEKKSEVISEEDLNAIAGGDLGDIAGNFYFGMGNSPLGIAEWMADKTHNTSGPSEKAAAIAGSATSTLLIAAASIGAYKGVKWAYKKIKG